MTTNLIEQLRYAEGSPHVCEDALLWHRTVGNKAADELESLCFKLSEAYKENQTQAADLKESFAINSVLLEQLKASEAKNKILRETNTEYLRYLKKYKKDYTELGLGVMVIVFVVIASLVASWLKPFL